jgi:hypothetical protein
MGASLLMIRVRKKWFCWKQKFIATIGAINNGGPELGVTRND